MAMLTILLIVINEPIPTSKEKLVIIPTTSSTTTRTQDSTITLDDDYRKTAIGELIKTQINRSTTIPIKIHITTLNIIIANIVFATLINNLEWFIWQLWYWIT